MLVVTTENAVGYRVVKVLGTVFGISVRSRGFIGNALGNMRAVFGGNQQGFIDIVEETRQAAVADMMRSAADMGANAILMMRFDSGEFGSGKGQAMNEVVAYGTAAVLESGQESVSRAG
jgi:uncharacterized protein YbjQ (UPF0145 family)